MNYIGKIVPMILLFAGIILWSRSCLMAKKDSINEILKDQRTATAIIESKSYNSKRGDSDYYYSFYADSIKYTSVTNAATNKNAGDTLSIYYSAKTPATSYYYKENNGAYSFSIIDVVVELIAVAVLSLIVYARYSKRQKER